jgi:glycosyltransferase involved in cell wall biosynthesis
MWQWGAYRVARHLTRTIAFDCVHHVTFVGVRAPSFMGLLGLRFILGPVSGGESVPRALRVGMTRAARWRELVRDLANWAIHADPLMRSSFRRAERIFLTTPESLGLIPEQFREKSRVQLGIGLSREYLGWTNQKRNQPSTGLRLLYVGRLLEWKGLDLAIHAVRRLRDRGVVARFTIVGDGPAASQSSARAIPTTLANFWMRGSRFNGSRFWELDWGGLTRRCASRSGKKNP